MLSLREAWRMSKAPYVELVYRSSQLVGSPVPADEGAARKRVRSALRDAKVNKAMFSLFGCLGAAVPFAVALSPQSLASSVALSLLVTFAYIVLYTLQVLPSFSGADAYSFLLTLPFTERDYSRIATFSFLRTFDVLAAGAVLVQVAAVAALTGSLAGSLLMLVASSINAVLAVFAGLWLSRVFYGRMTRGGRSRGATVMRMLFIAAWGFAVLSVGFAFQIVTSFLPVLHEVLAGGLSDTYGVALLALHPFSLGLAVSSLAFPAFFSSSRSGIADSLLVLSSYVSTLGYSVVAVLAAFGVARILSKISHGQAIAVLREAAKDYALRLRRPLYAYVLKDVRLASKNPSTAFVFILPIFGTLVFYTAISEGRALNVLDVLLLTLISSVFAAMAGLLLLNTEGGVLNYALTLPMGANIVVESKTLISTLVYLPVPFLILAIRLFGPGGLSLSSLVPFAEVLAVGAATTGEVALLVRGGRVVRGGPASGSEQAVSPPVQVSSLNLISGANLGRVVEAVLVALVLLAMPLGAYLTTYSSGYPESASISALTLIAVLELAAAHAVRKARR